ncbi:MAG: 7-cyano-7-deazaguanine synthase QueC [Candidatus Omnitrophota bacterium]
MPKREIKKAVVLLSGGLDSATTLYVAEDKGYDCRCLIFDYGQRHRKELNRAVAIAVHTGCPYHILKIRLPWRGSSLLDRKAQLPKGRNIVPREIPSTYVPSRNIIFLSFAASLAETIQARTIFIGANAVDYSGYPDCRPEFYKAFQNALDTGTKAGVEKKKIKIETPLIGMTKAEIIQLGTSLKVPYKLTWSCYAGGRKPCGECDSCRLRAKGFEKAGLKDPILR